MSTSDASQPAPPPRLAGPVTAVLAVWFVVAVLIAYTGLLQVAPGALPLPVLFSVAPPLIIFFGLYGASRGFRAFLLALDLRWITIAHAWRTVGFVFLAFYAFDMLPGLFAFPAGLGDIAVALTAPLVVLALVDRPDFARSRVFVTWHLLGLLDFVVAFATGILTSGAFAHLISVSVTSSALTKLPLAIIPIYLVPLFVMLHLVALFQARHLARSAARREADVA